jgi:ribosomal protein S18 acetylase RimI-like enzyme
MEWIRGQAIAGLVEELGQFRITIFREYPYLYDGSMEYERQYLARYATSPNAVVALERDGLGFVAVATGIALCEETSCYIQPFCSDPEHYFYIGEIMVRTDCRGQGRGTRLLQAMMEEGRRQGFPRACLYTVRRDPGHPARPADYRSPDGLWVRMGFTKVPGCEIPCSWKEIGEEVETEKPMDVWVADLVGLAGSGGSPHGH